MWRKKNETVNHIVSEYSKLVQKEYKARRYWQSKATNWELRNRLNFDYTTKSYQYKLKSDIENETHKTLCDFEIQTGHLIPHRRLDLVSIRKRKKNNLASCGLWRSGGKQKEHKRKRRDRQILGPRLRN